MFLAIRSTITLLVLFSSILHAYSFAPFDIRIDHFKVDTTRDLIINTPYPRFSWKIPVSNRILERNVQQVGYQFQLGPACTSTCNSQFNYDSGYVRSSKSVHVPCTGIQELASGARYRFRLRIWTTTSTTASEWTDWIQFRTSIFNLTEYIRKQSNAIWIGSTKINMNEFRKEFTVPNTSPIKDAIVQISGVGYYELYLNGMKVDPSRKLDPGWTTYDKRTLFASFDLTKNISAGMNAFGVKLGNGWYSREQGSAYGPPRFFLLLNITFENGNEMDVVSDQTWTGREGSIMHDSIYNGEEYDSRRDRLGWAQAGFNDSLSAWIMPEALPPPANTSAGGLFSMQDMPPIRAGPDALHFEIVSHELQQGYINSEEIPPIQGASLTDGIITPVKMWTSQSGLDIFDLGQNIPGWCRFKFRGSPGVGVYIRHGEVLAQPVTSTNHADGNIYTDNLREAFATDTYVLRGDPIFEVYEPTFTYHGFRYVSVSGSPNRLALHDVECPVVHTETTVKGHFISSNPIVNQIQHNIQWGQLSNMMSLPTDCPQRNERRGWMGDAALTVNEALYNFDLIKVYLNFLNLITDVQKADGSVPNYVPGDSFPPDPNWGTALPTITWELYHHYGDVDILKTYYNSVRAYVEFIRSNYNAQGLEKLYCVFGDWVPPPPQPMTNRHVISSFAFLHDVSLLINMSQVLGKTNDTEAYSALYQHLAEEFHRAFFVNTSKFYADGMQAAQILALALPNVVPQSVRTAVLNYLVTDIAQKGNHVTTGIVSTAQLYPLLSDNGHHDLALELISSTTYPSYGFMFMNPYENATTVWELWNSPYEGPGMNSRNHIMFGSVGAWFYSHLAGIDLSQDIITIRPRMASESKKHLMKKIDCQLSTLYGLVHISYTRDERDVAANSILLRVTIPSNTRARVLFEPLFNGARCKRLLADNQIIWSIDQNVRNNQQFSIEQDDMTNLMKVYIGSGQYDFQAEWE